jgi:hypothetical protein
MSLSGLDIHYGIVKKGTCFAMRCGAIDILMADGYILLARP